MTIRRHIALLALLAGGISIGSVDAQAAENAAGWYALGTKASMAGFTPPPGTYFVDVNMFYEGSASAASAVGVALQDISPAARELNLKGELLVEAKADVTGRVYYNLPSVLWVAPGKVLGGNVGFGAIVPFGSKDVDFDLDVLATLNLGPPINRTFTRGQTFSESDSSTEFGDPVLNALIGWHEGKLALERERAHQCPDRPLEQYQQLQSLLQSLGVGHHGRGDLARPEDWPRSLGRTGLHLQLGEPRYGLPDGHRVPR